MDESMQPLRPYEKHDTLKQFLDHDRHVLRFFCYWDDSEAMFGDPREMVLHYFLADDTIEIREIIPQNSGTVSFNSCKVHFSFSNHKIYLSWYFKSLTHETQCYAILFYLSISETAVCLKKVKSIQYRKAIYMKSKCCWIHLRNLGFMQALNEFLV